MRAEVIIAGGGLAGSEAAWQLAERGVPVALYEMRPQHPTPAHKTGLLAEWVCSNSLKSNSRGAASGLLKEELRRAGSLLLRVADECAVPGGAALAVDRERFSSAVTQAIETHIDVLAPGSYGQRHGHMNSAVFYILEGKGYDVHDGARYDWEAGDACIVENACVHQHFNADPDREARILVFKAKPTFLFFHLMFQKNVEYPPSSPQPGFETFRPEE